MNKEKEPKVRFDPYLIREIAQGYKDIDWENKGVMYDAYERGYKMLYNDLEKTNSQENPESFHVIVEKAGCNMQSLQQKTAANCEQIMIFSENFLNRLGDESKKLNSEYSEILIGTQNDWYNALQNVRLREGIELIRLRLSMLSMVMDEQQQNTSFHEVFDLILGSLKIIEEKIVVIAEKYLVFKGLSNAHSYALRKGKLIPFETFTKTVSNLRSGLNWCGPDQMTVNELFTYGHSLDKATKIRFTALMVVEGMSSSEAYQITRHEVIEMGIKPEEYLPDEAKNMLNRSVRYKNKRMRELREVNMN